MLNYLQFSGFEKAEDSVTQISFSPHTHMAGFLDASFMLVLTGLLHCCSAEVIYVNPTPTTQCWQTPCQTLSDYLHPPINFSVVSEMVFLPGRHTLDSDIDIGSHGSFIVTGDATSLPRIVTTIVCSDMHSISFREVLHLKVSAIEFQAYGTIARIGTVVLFLVDYSEFKNVCFQHNFAGGVFVLHSTLHIADSRFRKNTAAPDGEAIRVTNSTVTLSGTNHLTNNSAEESGGAIYASDSTLNFVGYNIFVGNAAAIEGGGIGCVSCNINMSGTVIFSENTANATFQNISTGGAIDGYNSTFIFNVNNIVFNQNKADYGSILYCDSCFLDFHGNQTFIENNAYYNGGIYLHATKLILKGNTTFSNNQANWGAGIYAYNGATIAFNGTSNFTYNRAGNEGAGIFIDYSNLTFDGITFFSQNEAGNTGEFVQEIQVSLLLRELVTLPIT